MERRAFRSCDESLPLLRKSGDCNDGGETFGVCRGLPGAVFFKVFANMTVFLTAKPKDFERSCYNPLIRLIGQLIWWLPSNIKNCSALLFFKSHQKRLCVAPCFSDLKNTFGLIA